MDETSEAISTSGTQAGIGGPPRPTGPAIAAGGSASARTPHGPRPAAKTGAPPQVRRAPATRAASAQHHVRQEAPLDHAMGYVAHHRWDVFPGAWLETARGVPRCCCGDAACVRPGAHPLTERWASEATGSASTARQLWTVRPHASVLLPTGRAFDAVETPDSAGCLALARLERRGTALGPVSCTPDGRILFFVLPGGAWRVPDLVRRLGWAPGALDLAAHGENGWVAAPPTRLGAKGPLRWVREPTAANRWLPDVEELMPALAYACGREAAAARGH